MSELAKSSWRCVWVTGASSGIGEALIKRLDGNGASIAASARSSGKLTEISRQSTAVFPFPVDVTDAAAIADSVGEIELAHGPIDLAILNAGSWALMDSDELNLDLIRNGVDVNYMGVVNTLSAVLPSMLKRGSGHIAITASVSGYRGLPKAIAYGPTKAALINLAETLRCELAPRGIIVSLINPGFVDTPMTRENPFPMPDLITSEEAAKRIVKGLRRGTFEIAFPTRFAFAMKCLRLMPNSLYFWIVRRFILKS